MVNKVKKNKAGTVIAFTIDRAKWLSGGDLAVEKKFGEPRTRMLTRTGAGCCLGLYAKACGARGMATHMDEHGLPDVNPGEVADRGGFPKQCSWLVGPVDAYGKHSHTDLTEELICINDDSKLKPSDRERKIASRFRKVGIEVTFTGEYPKAQARTSRGSESSQ